MPPARSWAPLVYPKLFYWNELGRGGHFAQLEVPDLFVAEPFGPLADGLRGDPTWRVEAIDCAQDVANLRPAELAALLKELAAN